MPFPSFPEWMPEWLCWLAIYLLVLVFTPVGWFFLGLGLIAFGWLSDKWKYRRRRDPRETR